MEIFPISNLLTKFWMMFLFALWFVKYTFKLLEAICTSVTSCLNRGISAFLFVQRHEDFPPSWSGILIIVPADNFLDKLVFRSLNWGKGKILFHYWSSQCVYGQRLPWRPLSWETVQRCRIPSVLSDTTLLWEHMLVLREREREEPI